MPFADEGDRDGGKRADEADEPAGSGRVERDAHSGQSADDQGHERTYSGDYAEWARLRATLKRGHRRLVLSHSVMTFEEVYGLVEIGRPWLCRRCDRTQTCHPGGSRASTDVDIPVCSGCTDDEALREHNGFGVAPVDTWPVAWALVLRD
jgi:hypothetical protein